MKTAFVLVALVALSAAFTQYQNVEDITRVDIYTGCAFSTYHMWTIYGDMIMNNFDAFVDIGVNWLKDNILYVLLTPYVRDSTDLANAQSLWSWVESAVSSNGCCGLSMGIYIANTVITELWGRIDFSQFRSLIWANLNKYTTEGKFYYDQFFTTCPFMYTEIWNNYLAQYWPF